MSPEQIKIVNEACKHIVWTEGLPRDKDDNVLPDHLCYRAGFFRASEWLLSTTVAELQLRFELECQCAEERAVTIRRLMRRVKELEDKYEPQES